MIQKISRLAFADKLKYAALAVILIVGAWRRFNLPLIPIIDYDFLGYLNPVTDYFKSGHFTHGYARSFPYPLFVLVLTFLAHSIKAVTVVQHIFGLITGVLIFCIWEEPVFKNYQRKLIVYMATLLQLISTAYFLWCTGIILYEHTIRPESMAIYFIIVLLYLLIRDVGDGKRSVKMYGGLFFLTLFLFLFSPRWGLALPVSVLYIFGGIFKLTSNIRQRILLGTLPAILFAVLFVAPERYLVKHYDNSSDQFVPRQFFYSHLNIAKEVVAEDIARGKTVIGLTADTLRQLNELLQLPKTNDYHFRHLGFSPDEVFYGSVSHGVDLFFMNRQLSGRVADGVAEEAAFINHYNFTLVTSGFKMYVLRVITELGLYYYSNPGIERVYFFEWPDFPHVFDSTAVLANREIHNAGDIFDAYKADANRYAHYVIYSPVSFLRALYFLLQFSFLPVLLVFWFASALKKSAVGDMEAGDALLFNKLGAVCRLLFFIHFAMVFTVATLHTFGIIRYSQSIFPVAMLLQMASSIYILVFISYLLKPGNKHLKPADRS